METGICSDLMGHLACMQTVVSYGYSNVNDVFESDFRGCELWHDNHGCIIKI